MTTKYFKILSKSLFICIYIFLNISSDFLLRKTFSSENYISQNNYKLQARRIESGEEFPSEYILGPGDIIFLNFLGAPFMSSTFTINQEGEIYIPELNLINVSGFTINELEDLLKNKYSEYLFDPEVKISILKYRTIQVYIAGEVKRPGIYDFEASLINPNDFPGEYKEIPKSRIGFLYPASATYNFHRLDDVFRKAKGITNYADLSKIVVIRENSISGGGGKIKKEINFLDLLRKGDLSKNIRIQDGDTIIVSKTNKKIKDQIISFNKSNLSPEIIEVFVIGNIDNLKKGVTKLPQGSTLNQALAASGGMKLFTGKIEFIRLNNNGSEIRRLIDYDPKAPIESKANPRLIEGDIINVQTNMIGKTTKIIGQITNPFSTSFFIYSILSN